MSKNEDKSYIYEVPIENYLMRELEEFASAYKLNKWKVLKKILADGLKRKTSIFRSVESQKETLGDEE